MKSVKQDKAISGAFRFWVELDGMLVGGFSEASGLQAETEFEEYREGGLNGYTHRLPKATKYTPIILRRGLYHSSELWDWYQQVIDGKFARKSGSIILQKYTGEELCRWNFFEAYPIKWIGPELNATANGVAVESIELVHNGFKTIFKS